MSKQLMFELKSTVQKSGTNVYSNIPSVVRDVLKLDKGNTLKWSIYNDKTLEVEVMEDDKL